MSRVPATGPIHRTVDKAWARRRIVLLAIKIVARSNHYGLQRPKSTECRDTRLASQRRATVLLCIGLAISLLASRSAAWGQSR